MSGMINMRTIALILSTLALLTLGALAAEPDELVRTDIHQKVMAGSDLVDQGQLNMAGPDNPGLNLGIHYQFYQNGTMVVTDKIFGSEWPINVFAKTVFKTFPEVRTLELQGDGLTFER